FNKDNNISPTTIQKVIREGIEDFAYEQAEEMVMGAVGQKKEEYTLSNIVSDLEAQMEAAARNLQFEKAALIRDKIKDLKDHGLDPMDSDRQRRPAKGRGGHKRKKWKRI
ncbi:MAG: UvrB/UvrC motif-containing protein, partial [Candidatus Omnitrophica bacterium]|nr:UvrB/UvrC motif-containing protein [Candidatus Omnitrophota bacterium]